MVFLGHICLNNSVICVSHFLSLLGAILAFTPCKGQNFPKAHFVEDVRFLTEAAQYGHPAQYRQDANPIFSQLYKKAIEFPSDSIEAMQYRLRIDEVLYNIGCTHTYVLSNPLPMLPDTIRYFPLALHKGHEAIKVVSDPSGKLLGAELLSVNGLSIDSLYFKLRTYRASDGGTDVLGKAYFNAYASILISAFFSFPAAYELEWKSQATKERPAHKLNVAANDAPVTTQAGKMSLDTLCSGLKAQLLTDKTLAVLSIKSFSSKDIRFYKRTIRSLQKCQYDTLVIDLRGNSGGQRKAAISLATLLVDSAFNYKLVQPKIQTKKYLDPFGRRAYRWSRLRYNWANLFRKRSSPEGSYFQYNFKPVKEPFHGTLYVLTDGFSSSAATMLSTWLDQSSRAIFAGTQASGGYNGHNAGSYPTITLPKSGIQIKWPAYRIVVDSRSEQNYGRQPDLTIEPTLENLMVGRDIAIEEIRKAVIVID